MKYSVISVYENGEKALMALEEEKEEDIPYGSYLPPFDEIPKIKEKLNSYFHHHQIMHGKFISADVVEEKSKASKNFSKSQIPKRKTKDPVEEEWEQENS